MATLGFIFYSQLSWQSVTLNELGGTCAHTHKGLFINYVSQSGGTGGVSQKMTQDDRGMGGGLAKDDR